MADKVYEYHLHHWGQIMNDEERWLEKDLGITEQNHWFPSASKRAEFRRKLEDCAHEHNCIIAFEENEGHDVRLRTVARMIMRLQDGRAFDYEYDFGYAYDLDSANYIWQEGNYACDCNKSLFLKRAGHNVEDIDCGDTITLENFSVIQEPN